jgi:hypothetical protein
MRTIGKRSGRDATKARISTWLTLGIAVAMFSALAGNGEAGGFCSKTARAQFIACRAKVRVDRFIGKATCINTSNAEERKECFTELNAARKEGNRFVGSSVMGVSTPANPSGRAATTLTLTRPSSTTPGTRRSQTPTSR